MAEFSLAYNKMIRNEGGYINHKILGDRGGQTYAGISRTFHGDWPGWALIDNNELNSSRLNRLVFNFYKDKFWNRISGDQINNQKIAESMFDFSVNAGVRTSIKLVQVILGVKPDGIVGERTLKKLNQSDEELFVSKYSLAKVARYTEIVNRDRRQIKFLLGWLNRTLKALS